MFTFHPVTALACLLVAALLAGCGQKGALYLPEQQSQSTPQQNPPPKP